MPETTALRALVVDDDDDIRTLMRRALERSGFVVVDFADAESLIAAHDQLLRADVVVSDIGLPGLDGIDVCASVLSWWPELPVILVTAFRDEDLLQRAYAAGARQILTKPLDVGVLALQARALAREAAR